MYNLSSLDVRFTYLLFTSLAYRMMGFDCSNDCKWAPLKPDNVQKMATILWTIFWIGFFKDLQFAELRIETRLHSKDGHMSLKYFNFVIYMYFLNPFLKLAIPRFSQSEPIIQYHRVLYASTAQVHCTGIQYNTYYMYMYTVIVIV